MPLIPLKCPNCNGDIRVDSSNRYAYCMYCGTKILISDAAAKDGSRTRSEAYLRIAADIALRSPSEAYSYARKATEEDPSNPEAWAARGLYAQDPAEREDSFRNARSMCSGPEQERIIEKSLNVASLTVSWSSTVFNWNCGLEIDGRPMELGWRMGATVSLSKGPHEFIFTAPSKGLRLEKEIDIRNDTRIRLDVKRSLLSTKLILDEEMARGPWDSDREDILRDQLAYLHDIALPLELEVEVVTVDGPHVQLGIGYELHETHCREIEVLDHLVWKDGEYPLLPGDALLVHGDYPHIREHQLIAYGLVCADDALPVDEQGIDVLVN